MSMKRSRLAALLAMILPLTPLHAASSLTYSGDSMTTVLAEGNQRAVLSGHARVETEDTVIRADRIELYGKDFIYAQCSGNVKIVNTKRGMELASEELFYDRQQKIARISGNAVMTDLKNELVVKGGFIEDRDNEQLTVVQIGVRILKKDLVCRSEFARYDREKKTLELSGLPWVSRKGDEYRAARITVNLDTEDIALQGDVMGQIATGQQSGSGSPPAQGGPAAPETKPASPGAATPAPEGGATTPQPTPAPEGGAPAPQQPPVSPQGGGVDR